MANVLLVGGTGNLGRKVAQELRNAGHEVTAIVRNEQRASILSPFIQKTILADVLKPDAFAGAAVGIDVVVSTLGKSVSLFDFSRPSFEEVDYEANRRLLDEARRQGIRKFIYMSALGAENHPDLTYFSVHHRLSEDVKASGLDYGIVKPPALFSAFRDLMQLAKKGALVTPGDGLHRTNPIYEGDLARIIVETIHQPSLVIEAGGPVVYTRKEINELIQKYIAPEHTVRSIPLKLALAGLPVTKWHGRNLYDKTAFFLEVIQHDVLAPMIGHTTLEMYLQQRLYEQ